jgi:hypothetical protein
LKKNVRLNRQAAKIHPRTFNQVSDFVRAMLWHLGRLGVSLSKPNLNALWRLGG